MAGTKKSGSTKSARRGRKKMTAQEKAAKNAVDTYLKAIGRQKPRGRQVSVDVLKARRDELKAEAAALSGVRRLKRLEEIREVEARIAAKERERPVDLAPLEADFVKYARAYGEANGISYGTWRDAGVPAAVLKKAGITRTRG